MSLCPLLLTPGALSWTLLLVVCPLHGLGHPGSKQPLGAAPGSLKALYINAANTKVNISPRSSHPPCTPRHSGFAQASTHHPSAHLKPWTHTVSELLSHSRRRGTASGTRGKPHLREALGRTETLPGRCGPLVRAGGM